MIINKIPRAEHPNPMCIRDSWHNLNGVWECAIDNEKMLDKNSVFPLKINVPFAPESKLSGIANTDFIKRIWYRRSFHVSTAHDMRTLLNFGACDYETTVWINDTQLEKHYGGQSSFTYDITEYLNNGENVITV
ncbi:MAG: beta galactosidase jelly roll domain-containing protein, partial [Clostridia bacterium]|nr:beta galactosidase jelly roll domain-containing protein [Clostridia bacterium]